LAWLGLTDTLVLCARHRVNEVRFTNFDKNTVEVFEKEFTKRFGGSSSS
jgi:hypothetical protein